MGCSSGVRIGTCCSRLLERGSCGIGGRTRTRVGVELEVGLKRASELKAFLEEVPYRRYERLCEKKRKRRQGH